MAAAAPVELVSQRLRLRQWQAGDLAVFAAMNADPAVMRYFPATLTTTESEQVMQRIQDGIAQRGWGFWAAQLLATQETVGFVGLNHPDPSLPCAPCTEIGWRLARQYWGKGYASEAARRALEFAFDDLALGEVLSFTAVQNNRSRAVMQRLGFINTGRNFEHPLLPAESALREHVLYSLSRTTWRARTDTGVEHER